MRTDADRRIARNTLFLYLRMFITLGVNVYASRVILDVLGVEDYGIYNLVAGVVVMLTFLNATLGGTTQRFLNYEMGRGESERLRDTFSAAWKIHCWLGVFVVVVGETLGLWAVNHYLVISPERLSAANWVYQYSVVGAVVTVMIVPFSGAVFAHERMGMFALVQLSTSLLKLGIVFILMFIKEADSLVMYAAMLTIVQLGQFAVFMVYCLKEFPECTLSMKSKHSMIMALLRYSGADFCGTTLYVAGLQGVIVVINRVGGVLLNAAAGVASTVSGAVNQFGNTIVMAFRPQIISEYAAGNYGRMQTLMTNCTKYSILLFGLFAVPVIVEMEYILKIWLKTVPMHSVMFCRLALVASLMTLAIQTLNAGMHATGRIFRFSLFTGISYVVNLPVIYVMMTWTGNPDWAYIVPIIQLLINVWLIQVMLHNRMPEFNGVNFFIKGFIAPITLLALSALSGRLCVLIPIHDFLRLVVTTLVTSAVIAFGAWTLFFTPDVKSYIISRFKNIFAH